MQVNHHKSSRGDGGGGDLILLRFSTDLKHGESSNLVVQSSSNSELDCRMRTGGSIWVPMEGVRCQVMESCLGSSQSLDC